MLASSLLVKLIVTRLKMTLRPLSVNVLCIVSHSSEISGGLSDNVTRNHE